MKTVYKHIVFVHHHKPAYGKEAWACWNSKHGECLGWVTWYPTWNQYVYNSKERHVIYSASCLEDIAHFLKQLNEQEK